MDSKISNLISDDVEKIEIYQLGVNGNDDTLKAVITKDNAITAGGFGIRIKYVGDD